MDNRKQTATIQKWNGFEDLLFFFAEVCPDDPALLFAAGEGIVSMTRKEFAAAARDRAALLRAGGKSCIGVLCDGSAECVLTIFGAVLAGLQTVLLDENAADELLSEQIRETDIDLLWGEDELCEQLQPCLTGGLPELPEERRLLFFTSGTIAQSKAVVLTDSSLMAAAFNGSMMLPLQKQDTLLCMLPLNHVFGFVCGLLWGLECGAGVALGRGMRYYAQDPAYFKPTVLSAVPALIGFLMQHKLINPELRLVLIGAGDCPAPVLHAARAAGLAVSFGYGLTETSSGVAISVSGDPYALSVCPEDTVTLAGDGEILVSSPACMMLGYYKHPADTAAVLKDGILHTGDLGRWDENGLLHIIGRKKEILVLADGTKIFLPEYEARIAPLLPDTDFAVTLLDGRPVLLISKKPADVPEDLAEKCSKALQSVMAQLPRGQQISRILFTDRPLPRTAAGKLMRWELQKIVQ